MEKFVCADACCDLFDRPGGESCGHESWRLSSMRCFLTCPLDFQIGIHGIFKNFLVRVHWK